MPDLRPIVDAEQLLIDHLLADADVAALVDTNVSAELPEDFGPQARIQLFRIGGIPNPGDVPGHLDQPSLQLNIFGATKAEAFDVAAQAIRATLAAPAATHAGAVVTGARRVLGPTWSPDPGTNPPVARYIVGVVLSVHPDGS